MKKRIILLTILMTLLIPKIVNGKELTLEQIKNNYIEIKYNECLETKQYHESIGKEFNSDCNKKNNITITNNKLVIVEQAKLNNEMQKIKITYSLNKNILSTTFEGNNPFFRFCDFKKLFMATQLLQGYSEDEINIILHSENIDNYTIEKNGFEIKTIGTNENMTGGYGKIDISKKINIGDKKENTGISKKDIENYNGIDSLKSESEKDNLDIVINGVAIYKSYKNGKYILSIGEQNKLTDASYKTLKVVNSIIFDEDKRANKYLEKYYPKIGEDKNFIGYEIDINPTNENHYYNLFPDFKFIEIRIDKARAKEQFYKVNDKKDNQIGNFIQKNKYIFVVITIFIVIILGIFILSKLAKKDAFKANITSSKTNKPTIENQQINNQNDIQKTSIEQPKPNNETNQNLNNNNSTEL